MTVGNYRAKFTEDGRIQLYRYLPRYGNYEQEPRADYKLIQEPFCELCSYPGTTSLRNCSQRQYHPMFLKRIYCIGKYFPSYKDIRGYLSRDIVRMKYDPKKAEILGVAIAACIKAIYKELLKFDLITWVPKSGDELAMNKGYNPAESLGAVMGKKLGIHYRSILTKTKNQSLTHLSIEERKLKTTGLYRCIKQNHIKNKFILIVDDIATSNSTLDACADELLKSGAREVRAFVCGRTIRY